MKNSYNKWWLEGARVQKERLREKRDGEEEEEEEEEDSTLFYI